jgi:hypothetical protein
MSEKKQKEKHLDPAIVGQARVGHVKVGVIPKKKGDKVKEND